MAVYVLPAFAPVGDSVFVSVAPEDLVPRVFLVFPGEIGFYLVVEDMGHRGWVELFEVFWLPQHPSRFEHVVSLGLMGDWVGRMA
eukprot:11399026-Alexandrium_andersonii.AAC.1